MISLSRLNVARQRESKIAYLIRREYDRSDFRRNVQTSLRYVFSYIVERLFAI
jgi:hypothetical protein